MVVFGGVVVVDVVVVVEVVVAVVDVLVGSEVVLTIIDGAGPTTEDGIIDGDDAEEP